MNKKNAVILVGISVLVIIAVGGFLAWKSQQQEAKRDQLEEQIVQEIDNNIPEKKEEANNDWKTYRNEEYGFEMKYPKDWEIIIRSSDPNKQEKKDSFIFEKEEYAYFAVLPNGGFGHGIQDPIKIENKKFNGKNAEKYWYDYPFPLYTSIKDNLPKNWNSSNVIDIRISDIDINQELLINDLQYMYESFRFIE